MANNDGDSPLTLDLCDDVERGTATSAANENTPLVLSNGDGQDDGATLSGSSSHQTTTTKAQKSWTKIVDHVKSGLVLLHQPSLADADGEPEETMDDRDIKLQHAQDLIRRQLDFTLTQCVLAILCYIGIAVVAFSFVFDDWTIIDSVYFSVVTFSTVGYGDLVPTTHAARAFTAFFALSSIGCLGIAIGVVGKNIIDAQENALNRARALSEHRVLSLFSASRHSAVSLSQAPVDEDVLSISTTTVVSDGGNLQRRKPTRSPELCRRVATEFVMVAGVLFIFGIAVAQDPAIRASDVGYFLVITSTAVGFGDITPTSEWGRLATAIFIPIAVGAMGRWMAMVASWIIENRQRSFRRYLETHELTLQDIEVMDADGDGNVSRAEFLEFMLVAMGKIDRDLVEQLRTSFAKLDVEANGVLSKGDLIALARRKLKDPKRKLELARYKSRLLEQARKAGRRDRRSRASFWGSSISIPFFEATE